MIRQAHTYLVSAMSGATLIAIAIAAFVVLVSAQVFSDWPIAALGGNDRAAVSEAQPVAGDDGVADAAPASAVAAGAVARRGAPAGAGRRSGRGGDQAAKVGNSAQSRGVAVVPTGSGSTETGAEAGGGGSAANGGASQPSSPTPTSAPAAQGGGSNSSGSVGGGSAGSGGGSSGGGSGSPTTNGGGSSDGGSTSGAVTETVNGTVATVDEKALGGTLDSTGVTGATEEVVNGVAGPESVVGKVVDETVKTVGGLLGGNR